MSYERLMNVPFTFCDQEGNNKLLITKNTATQKSCKTNQGSSYSHFSYFFREPLNSGTVLDYCNKLCDEIENIFSPFTDYKINNRWCLLLDDLLIKRFTNFYFNNISVNFKPTNTNFLFSVI